jgi:hypothetical protein
MWRNIFSGSHITFVYIYIHSWPTYWFSLIFNRSNDISCIYCGTCQVQYTPDYPCNEKFTNKWRQEESNYNLQMWLGDMAIAKCRNLEMYAYHQICLIIWKTIRRFILPMNAYFILSKASAWSIFHFDKYVLNTLKMHTETLVGFFVIRSVKLNSQSENWHGPRIICKNSSCQIL